MRTNRRLSRSTTFLVHLWPVPGTCRKTIHWFQGLLLIKGAVKRMEDWSVSLFISPFLFFFTQKNTSSEGVSEFLFFFISLSKRFFIEQIKYEIENCGVINKTMNYVFWENHPTFRCSFFRILFGRIVNVKSIWFIKNIV